MLSVCSETAGEEIKNMKNARQISFEILNKIQRDNSYSNLTLDSELEKMQSSETDKRFVSALVYGVTERKITLDYQFSLYLNQPLKKLKPQVLTALRLGAYQLLFMDKIPPSAAVNESVKLVKNNQAAFASGLVNAVLRKIEKNGIQLPDEKKKDYLSVKYSCPQWLIDLWLGSYGEDNCRSLLEASFGATETTVRVNTLKCTCDELIEKLNAEGFKAEKIPYLPNALTVENGGAIHKTQCYKDGLFHVQDAASQLCCSALDVMKNETVLDICAAPGGKSFTLGEQMNNTGKILSFDVYEQRLKLIKNGAERLGLENISALKNDGAVRNPHMPPADKILCDVPCAGLGVIRKKPEIRYKEQGEVDKLPDLQYSILCVSAEYLKVGGTLVYSTCSLNPEENEKIIEKFLLEHKDFESVRVLPELERYGGDTDYISLMPHIHNCDGFFISAVRKIKEV